MGEAMKDAVGWAIWTVQHTDMAMSRILRRASEKFGVPQAAVKRGIRARLGDEYLTQRAERMKAEGRKRAPSDVRDEMRRRSSLYGESHRAERHLREISRGT